MDENYLEILIFCMNESIPVCLVSRNENVSAYNATITSVKPHLIEALMGERELKIPTDEITSIGILIKK